MIEILKVRLYIKGSTEIWGYHIKQLHNGITEGNLQIMKLKKWGAILVTHQGMERIAGEINEEKRQKEYLET